MHPLITVFGSLATCTRRVASILHWVSSSTCWQRMTPIFPPPLTPGPSPGLFIASDLASAFVHRTPVRRLCGCAIMPRTECRVRVRSSPGLPARHPKTPSREGDP